MLYVPQIQNDDCGFACVKMLLANVQRDKNYLFLPQDEKYGPYSYQELIDIAKAHGVTLEGLSTEDKTSLNAQFSKNPFIATIMTSNGGSHAVLVYKVKWGRVYYLDPRLGKLDLSIKKFADLWDGTMLMVNSITKTACPYQEAKPLSIGQIVLLNLLEVMAGLLLIAGVYFIKDEAYVFIPITLFALAAIFEMLMKAYSISLMKRVDVYFYEQLEVTDNDYYSKLQRFERYKKSLLANPLQFVLTLIVAMGLMFVTLQNDIYNFLLIAAPLIASVIEAYLYRPYIKSGFIDVEEQERALNSSENIDDFRDRVDQIHKKSYKIGLLEMTKQYIGLALFIVVAVLLLAIKSTPNFPYAVFYTCIEVAIYVSFRCLFLYPDKMDELLKAKVEINNCLHQIDENK